MYRVYDYKKESFIVDNIYLSPHPNSELYVLKKDYFKRNKLVPADNERYVYQKDIGLLDKNERLIFEGDIIEANVSEDRIVVGLVVYSDEFSSYIILCYDTNEYFSLGEPVREHIKVIGNIMENKDLLPIDVIERE